MPLDHGYCVVIGTLDHYERDDPNNFGQFYHETVFLNTPEGIYKCAIDVDSQLTNDGIEWRVIPMSEGELKGVGGMSNGRHDLLSHHQTDADKGGAIDYVRTAGFHKGGCVFFRYDPFLALLAKWFNLYVNPPWSAGNSIQALSVLEPLLDQAQRIFIFGEPFHFGGLGVHNIHQNQGDPVASGFSKENGIWQDGGTIIQKTDGSYVAFLNKFTPQSYNTNNDGKPVP